MSTIGKNIKARRQGLDLTQEDLARQASVTKQTIQKYESGIISNIPSDKIEILARVLETTPAALMGWESDSPTSEDAGDPLSEYQKKVLAILGQIPKEKQDAFLEVLETLAQKGGLIG